MKPLLCAALALALAGCAAMDPAGPPMAELDPARLGLAGSGTAWPDAAWWRRYADEHLNGLIEAALADNPSLALAQARLARANAAVAGARAPLMPRVDANYSLTREHLSGNYTYGT